MNINQWKNPDKSNKIPQATAKIYGQKTPHGFPNIFRYYIKIFPIINKWQINPWEKEKLY